MINTHITKEYLYPAICMILLFFGNIHIVDAAASLEMRSVTQEIGRGQEIEVSVYLDTDSEIINALEGRISIPDAFEVQDILSGNSFISLWTEKPQLKDDSISFAGIVPGGFKGKNAFLFSLILDAQSFSESAILSGEDIRVFLHDGEGNTVDVDVGDLEFVIQRGISVFSRIEEHGDTQAPEIFTPLVSSSPSMFNGDYFVVFSAQDKGSGIQQYEIKESKTRLLRKSKGIWTLAQSPYRLNDQSLKSFIYIRATDEAGNTRIVSLAPDKLSGSRIFIMIILIFMALGVGIRSYFLRKKHDELL